MPTTIPTTIAERPRTCPPPHLRAGALYTAGRQEELLGLLETARFKWWLYRRWGVKALVVLGRKSAALRDAEASRELNQPDWWIAQVCEEILLSSRLSDEAYARYAIEVNQSTTNLATF